jgi:hypothetical protein
MILLDQLSKCLEGTQLSVHHNRSFPQSSAVVDFAWYPGASSSNAPAYCFIASVRDCPVKLLDASDGRVVYLLLLWFFVPSLIDPRQLRASYPIVDHRERHIAPHSLSFNLTADK